VLRQRAGAAGDASAAARGQEEQPQPNDSSEEADAGSDQAAGGEHAPRKKRVVLHKRTQQSFRWV
jgi:hypothetical protein